MNLHGKVKKEAAIFGGTFDPFHNGHLKVIEHVLQNFNLHKIFLIPAGNQYMKPKPPKATPIQRFNMCKLAIKNNLIELIDFEIQKTSPSYTFDTLKYIEKNFPDFSVKYIILGADAFGEISLWKEADFLKNNYKFIIIQRDKNDYEQNKNIFPVLKLSSISSSSIRNKISKKESILLDTPIEIQKYISDNYLYNDE
ncbi:MAG: nicotinate (nicotinamide) nucleotide adenylyltransferase [Dehalococcoidales bacterium]|jgi:nicotinate-nucleotide adenylyltransferase|nr:nicotinate (nicotinamide) nucleotide adenylyltransferase [Dehalococcoidales bacterium]